MAINVGNVSESEDAAASSLTFSHTVGNNDNRILIVTPTIFDDGGTFTTDVTGITYDGQALTEAVVRVSGFSSNEFVAIWYLIAPPVGTADIVVSFDTTLEVVAAGAVDLYGVAQTGQPEVTANEDDENVTTGEIDITTVADNAFVISVSQMGQTGDSLPKNLLDEYPFSNADDTGSLGDSFDEISQSFSSGSGGVLHSVRFQIDRDGSPTGNIVARLSTHSGTFGTSSQPGTLLATSDPIDVSTISLTPEIVEFQFTGANRVSLSPSTNYTIGLFYDNGDPTNHLEVAADVSSPTHSGNMWNDGGGAESGIDMVFQLFVGEQTAFLFGDGDSLNGAYMVASYSGPETPAGSVTHVYESQSGANNKDFVMAAVSIKPFTATTRSNLTLLGVS